MIRSLAVKLFVLFILFSQLLIAQTDESGYTVLERGEKAPALLGFSKDGQPFALQKNPDGATLICFLDPGCEWCKSLLTELNTLHDSLGDKLRIIGCTADTDSLRWESFTSESTPKFKFVVVSKSMLSQYKIQASPTLYLLDRKLRVASGRLVRIPDILAEYEKLK